MKSVTIILPATDETYSLSQTVTQAREVLPLYQLEFLIVTSPKLTTPICRETIQTLQQESFGNTIKTFDQSKPGIGGALQEAFMRATGEYTVLMASDLETDPQVLPSLLQKLDENWDIVTTTRWKGGSRFVGYNPVKLVLNFGFQLIFRTLYMTKLSDLTYAYRAYKTDILKSIIWEHTGFPFLFETIVKPLRLKYTVTEVNAPWKARTEGRSHANWKQVVAYTKLGIRVRFLPISKIRYTDAHE